MIQPASAMQVHEPISGYSGERYNNDANSASNCHRAAHRTMLHRGKIRSCMLHLRRPLLGLADALRRTAFLDVSSLNFGGATSTAVFLVTAPVRIVANPSGCAPPALPTAVRASAPDSRRQCSGPERQRPPICDCSAGPAGRTVRIDLRPNAVPSAAFLRPFLGQNRFVRGQAVAGVFHPVCPNFRCAVSPCGMQRSTDRDTAMRARPRKLSVVEVAPVGEIVTTCLSGAGVIGDLTPATRPEHIRPQSCHRGPPRCRRPAAGSCPGETALQPRCRLDGQLVQ